MSNVKYEKRSGVRDSRIELLRITSMLMIVLSHFSTYGNWSNKAFLSPLSTVRLLSFDPVGPAAACVFFVITGFFSAPQKTSFVEQYKKSKSKFLTVWKETLFYSVSIALIVHITGAESGLLSLIKAFLPFSLNEYWFVTSYLLLMLFYPYLNIVLSYLNGKQTFNFFLLLLVLQIPALLGNGLLNEILLAISGYVLGCVFSQNAEKISSIKLSTILMVGFSLYLIELFSIFLLRYLGFPFKHSAHFTQYVLAIFLAGAIFLTFTKLPEFSNKLINKTALSTFSVYLISEHPFMRHFIWHDLFDVRQFQQSPFWGVIGILIAMLVLFVCLFVDMGLRGVFSVFARHGK